MNSRLFLKIYLILAWAFGILGLIDGILTLAGWKKAAVAQIIAVIAFFFFFFNITTVALFRRYHAEKIAYILPIYHLVTYFIFFWISLVLYYLKAVPDIFFQVIILFSILLSLFEIIFSVYLLRKFFFFF